MSLLQVTEAIDCVNEGRDIPSFIKLNNQNAFRLKYVHTDGWRGYYDCQPVKKAGWVLADLDSASSWVTGDWSDAPEGHAASDVESKVDAYAKQQEARGYDTCIVFTPTSNVFSTSYDVFTRPKQ